VKIKNVHIFGGGTVSHIANHFAICAPAYGTTAKTLRHIMEYDKRYGNMQVNMELTKMAGGNLETNEDVAKRIEQLKSDSRTKIIFFNCALVDWKPNHGEYYNEYPKKIIEFGKYATRLETKNTNWVSLNLSPAEKIISNIRKGRKDIFLVGFKTTCGATKQEMYEKGLFLCKQGSVNLVLVNDTKTHVNFIVTPEEATYGDFGNRDETLKELVNITWHRSHLTFTQSTVVGGTPIEWNSEIVPYSLRTVVNYCIGKGAYKPIPEKKWTAGHFAYKVSDTEFLSSIRKSNLNEIDKIGLVYVKTDGPDTVIAYGAKPSVGGQSQRIVFRDHVGYDCIVHFHSELKKNHPDDIPIISQKEAECGSHECGKSTSNGLKEFNSGIKAVMLNNHGPNIVFNKNIDPQLVIDFIERNWDLNTKTGGYQI
jgi:DNA / pantothenate metabolism flavoprotein